MCVGVGTYIYAETLRCICMCLLCMYKYIKARTYINTCIHTIVQHTYTHKCIHASACTYAHEIQVYTHKHVYIHAYKHTHIHTYIHPSIHTYFYTYIHKSVHTYIYLHIYPQICSQHIHIFVRTISLHMYLPEFVCVHFATSPSPHDRNATTDPAYLVHTEDEEVLSSVSRVTCQCASPPFLTAHCPSPNPPSHNHPQTHHPSSVHPVNPT